MEKLREDRGIDHLEFNVANIAKSKMFFGKEIG